MDKGLIFYSNGIDEPIKSMVENSLPDLPIVKSYSNGNSYHDMVAQIVWCLKRLQTKYVFFCEHDVIYNQTHFDFIPQKDDVFYYNANVLRWDYPEDRYITYDRLISLSGMCANRKLSLDHFKLRQEYIKQFKSGVGEPNWLRKMGYEPGTKPKRKGGFSDDTFETWRSERPLIDIRHGKTFSPRKVHLKDFKHKPTRWKESNYPY